MAFLVACISIAYFVLDTLTQKKKKKAYPNKNKVIVKISKTTEQFVGPGNSYPNRQLSECGENLTEGATKQRNEAPIRHL